jgi:hypothetical protein
MLSKLAQIDSLNISRPRDEAVEDYYTWQKLQVKKLALKMEYQKACDVIIEDGMDLELIRRDPNRVGSKWLYFV